LRKAFLLTPRDTDVSWSLRNPEAGRLADDQPKPGENNESSLTSYRSRLISFAVPASIAQDAMKVVTADEIVWKDDTLFKGAQTAVLIGDPSKAETVVMRVKWPPNFKMPLHTHPVTEVLTVLSGN